MATTSSCHRTNHHAYVTDGVLNFHNTPSKLADRQRMLQGQWPERGCDYCQDIEAAGGQSDRLTNLGFTDITLPQELVRDPQAVSVSPKLLEIYFDNVCNLKCTYCGPHFSSLWDAENRQNGVFKKHGLYIDGGYNKNPDIERDKQLLFQWLIDHGHTLNKLNILGGEPLYQREFDQCLDLLEKHAMPDLELQIFSNLNTTTARLSAAVERLRDLIDRYHLKKFIVTASLDCWGPQQEYARFPLRLDTWQSNFEYLLDQEWIDLVVGSTVTPLTVWTLSDLVAQINAWNQQRPVYHYFNSVNYPSYMKIDIFGDLFVTAFDRALDIMPQSNPEQILVRGYLEGIRQQSQHTGINATEVLKLHTFLEEMDRRRGTDWRETYPELIPAFQRILGG